MGGEEPVGETEEESSERSGQQSAVYVLIPHQVKEGADLGTVRGYWWLYVTSLTQWGGGEHVWCCKVWEVQSRHRTPPTGERSKSVGS